ncbi:hypothetical protein [Spirosoma panaciterrae]|uniref:hypothetical protein n=1 Tax=Spirosoma panaciterrae TaxID=496058 RepID=UPI0012FBE750|nr:hypothetical protein [Spirosoma panaciterrae]
MGTKNWGYIPFFASIAPSRCIRNPAINPGKFLIRHKVSTITPKRIGLTTLFPLPFFCPRPLLRDDSAIGQSAQGPESQKSLFATTFQLFTPTSPWRCNSDSSL